VEGEGSREKGYEEGIKREVARKMKGEESS
jgi:hypothetical protein